MKDRKPNNSPGKIESRHYIHVCAHTQTHTDFAKGQWTCEKMLHSYWSSGKYKLNHTVIPLTGMAKIKKKGREHQVVGNPHIYN